MQEEIYVTTKDGRPYALPLAFLEQEGLRREDAEAWLPGGRWHVLHLKDYITKEDHLRARRIARSVCDRLEGEKAQLLNEHYAAGLVAVGVEKWTLQETYPGAEANESGYLKLPDALTECVTALLLQHFKYDALSNPDFLAGWSARRNGSSPRADETAAEEKPTKRRSTKG